jgi:hypothetical protein
MSCSRKFLLPALVLAIPVAVLAQSQTRLYPNVGTPLSPADIQSFDRMIGPDGKELPPGRGTAKEGAAVYAKRCEICHGKNGENGLMRSLVIGSPGTPYRGTYYGEERNRRSYYPYATIAWDYKPRDARQRSGIADTERSLRPGRGAVLLERHHQGKRRHGREDPAEGRNAEPEWLRSGSAGVSPAKET